MGELLIPLAQSEAQYQSVEEHTLRSTGYLVLNFHIKSTYRNLLWKTGVFLNVISGPEISIGNLVNF